MTSGRMAIIGLVFATGLMAPAAFVSANPAQNTTPIPTATAQTAATPAEASNAFVAALSSVPADRSSGAGVSDATAEGHRADTAAMIEFYRTRTTPVWFTEGALSDGGKALIAEMKNARDYGLDPAAFNVRDVEASATGSGQLTDLPTIAAHDVALTRAALLYARHARGGRIAQPAKMLNSNLDRKPQIIAPDLALTRLATSSDPAMTLRGFHPPHPQFERLRQAYLKALPPSDAKQPLSRAAKKIRANMEMWRWMWDDLGALHVFNNIPEFMQYVYKDGAVIRSERIVAGMIDKQSSVYSRSLKHVVLRPKWRVPESIMVHELWPSLLRGGGLMRQHGLEIETKSGEARNWRTIDWSKDDIRNYIVTQAPGPKSALGYVKFSFPSQHTIFMHDTPDKWMFKSARRTLSHGCLRVRNPMELAEIVLADDKGWDSAKVRQLSKSGPLNNEIAIDKNIPIHLAYFTAWVDDDGRLKAFYDVYGHEKRVMQALDGEWDRIDKGRDHLAPPQPNFNPAKVASTRRGPAASKRKDTSVGDMISNAMGLTF